jgi:hypothetical protein
MFVDGHTTESTGTDEFDQCLLRWGLGAKFFFPTEHDLFLLPI